MTPRRYLSFFAFALATPLCAQTTYTKANNTTALDQDTSWSPQGVPGSSDTLRWNGTYSSGAASIGVGLTVNRVQVQTPSVAISINAGTGPLTLGGNGFDLSAATQDLTVTAPIRLSAAQTWNINAGRILSFNAPITVTSGAPALTLTGSGTLRYNGTGAATPIPARFAAASGTFSVNQATGDVTFNATNFPAGSSSTFTSLVGASGARLTIEAAPTANLAFGSSAGGFNLVLKSGVVTFNSNISATNLRIEGGTFTSTPTDRFQLSNDNQTFTVTGGTVDLRAGTQYGFRLGAINSPNQSGARKVTATQTGGTVLLASLNFGGTDTDATKSPVYTLSGGVLTTNLDVKLGADSAGVGSSTLALSGTGKLRVSGTISGSQVGAKQILSLNGGTLAAGTVVTANLRPDAASANGTLVNNGATIAPRDVSGYGRTTITGALTLASGTVALELGGGTAATSAFNATNVHDNISVSGALTLGGQLAVYVPRPYIPAASVRFTVLTASGALTGDFTNAPADGTTRFQTADGNGSFLVEKEGSTVVLTDYRDNHMPIVTAQPETRQVQHGMAVTLSVTASNPKAGALSYQWYRNGVLMGGATSATLSFPSAAFTHEGEYTVTITNIEGTVTSDAAYLTVVTPVLMHYRMDQTPTGAPGAITDVTGNTTASIVGTPLPLSVAGAAAATGSAWDFSQTEAQLAITSTKGGLRNIGNLQNGLGLTIAFWWKPNVPLTDYRHQRPIARFGKHFWMDFAYPDPHGCVPRFNFGDGVTIPTLRASVSPRDGGPLADGEWHFYAITLDYRNPIGANGSLVNNVITYLDHRISGGSPLIGPHVFRFTDSFQAEVNDVFQLGIPNGQKQLWDNFIILNYPLNAAELTQLRTEGALTAHAPQTIARASSNLVIAPDNAVSLSADLFNFGQTLPVTTTWSVTKAPVGGTVTFANPSALATSATFNAVPGDYVLALTASNSTYSSTSYVPVTVLASLPLYAYASVAGQPEASVLTGASVTLNGASRLYQTPSPTNVTYLWSLVSGPAAPVFANAANPETTVSFTTPGTYVLRLTVTAPGGSTSTDVTVRAFGEMMTQVHGTASPQIMLWPANSTTLQSNVTQTNPSRPVTYAWSQVSGPGTTTFANAAAASTQATFSEPGVYKLRLHASSSAGSGESIVWINVWPRGPGNEAGLLPPQPRQYAPQPPPYVHPRLLFTEADRPDITWRTQNDPLTIAAVALLRTSVNNAFNQPGTVLTNGYQRLLAGEPGFSVQPLINASIYDRLSEAAYLAWLDQDTVRSREIGTVLTNALRDELTWNTTNNSRVRVIGIIYDLTFNALNEEQRVVCRAYLGPLTAIGPKGFQFIDPVYGASMAIYGEPGFDEAAALRNLERLRGAFEDDTYITPQGWHHEDPAYGGFTGWGINPAAHMYRQIEPLIVTGNVARTNLMEFFLLFADTTATTGGGMGGHSEAGWAHSGQQYLLNKYFYPQDQVNDFVRNANHRVGLRGDPLYEAIFAMSPLTPRPTFASAAAARAIPAAKLDAQRGIGLARSDWGPNAIQLDHDMRRWWGGHIHANVNDITLFASGRQWFANPGYGEFTNERHSTILIDGIGSGRNPARIVDAIDRAPLTFFAGDAQHAYTYTGTQSRTDTTDGVPTARTWREMLFAGSSDGFFPPALDMNAEWADNTVRVPATNGVANLLNPVQRAFRTSTMVRGARPYVLIFDDIQKDAAQRDYHWITNLPATVEARPDATASEAVLYHLNDGSGPGVPQLLARVISATGTSSPITVSTSTINGQTGRRLQISRTAVAPDFKILIFPHLNGEAAPVTSFSGGILTVAFADYTDRLTLQTTAEGRTRIIGFSRTLPGRTAPTVTTPASLQATADEATISPITGQAGAVLTFTTSATSDTGATLATTVQSPSGTVFPAGESLVYVSATDALGQITWRTFPVTVVPPAPVVRVEAVSNFTGSTSGINLSWDKVVRATAYSVKRATNIAGPYTVVSDKQPGITFAEAGLADGHYYYLVTSWLGTQEGPPSAVISSRVSLGEFTAAKLGTAVAGAGAYHDGESLLLCGTAGSLVTTPDDHVFASMPWTGDGVFTARVASLTPFNGGLSPYAIYGIMARTSIATNSAHVTSTYSSWSRPGRLWRSTTGGGVTGASIAPSGAPPRPIWVQLRRAGNVFTTFFSTDGVVWQPSADPVTASLPASVLVGPVVAARSGTVIHAARYDGFIFMGTPVLTLQSDSIKIDWPALVGPSFKVERATAAEGPYETIASALTSPTYTDDTVRQGVTYFYRVVGYTELGGDTASPAVSLRFPRLLAAPANVTITSGSAQFTLGWSAVAADDAPTYAVQRATNEAGPFTTIASGLSRTSYVDSNLVVGTAYHYRIVAEGSDVPAISSVVSGIAGSGFFAKANNTTALDQTAAWSPAVLPSLSDTISWNGTYANGTASIGAGLSVYRVEVLSPSTNITISAGTGSLTVGEGGFDLSAATRNLTVAAPVVVGASQTWNVASGVTLALNGGVSAGNTAHTVQLAGAGTLTFGGASSVVKLTPGTHTFGRIGHTSTSGTLVLDATGATVSLGKLGYNTATGWTTVLRGGTWTIGDIGINSTGSQNGGTTRLENSANVTITTTRFGGHGTWLVGGVEGPASLVFGSGLSSENGGSLGFVVRALDGGSVTVPALTLGLPTNNVTSASELAVSAGGLVHVGGNLTLGNTNTGKTETSTVSLSGGVLRVTGTVQAAVATAGQTRRFDWSGGRLAAGTITPSAGFDAHAAAGGLSATGLVHPAGAILAPGDLGTAGRTALNGAYTQSAPTAVLDLDIGGTTQATAYQTGQYDHFSITGAAVLAGKLKVRLVGGFTPTSGQSFTVLRATGGISGWFANVADGGRVAVEAMTGSFVVMKSGNDVVLSDYQPTTLREGWLLEHFGTTSAVGDAADDADPDGDGLKNLLEYAVGADPLATTPESKPVVTTASQGGETYLRLSFLRARADLAYVVETSPTLAADSWNAIATNPGEVGHMVLVEDTEPVSTNSRRFIRLSVTVP